MFNETLSVTEMRPFEMIFKRRGQYFYKTGQVSQSSFTYHVFGTLTLISECEEIYLRSSAFTLPNSIYVFKHKGTVASDFTLSLYDWMFLKLRAHPIIEIEPA